MEHFTSKVEPSGRILIPAALRRKLGLGPGVTVVIAEEDGVVRLQTKATALRKVQEYFAQFKDDGRSLVDELIAERRVEAEKEFA